VDLPLPVLRLSGATRARPRSLARRVVLGALATLAVAAALGGARLLLMPQPRWVTTGPPSHPTTQGIDTAAEGTDGMWVGTGGRGCRRVQDGWTPEFSPVRPDGGRVVGAVFSHAGHLCLRYNDFMTFPDRWFRQDGATFTALAADAPEMPSLTAALEAHWPIPHRDFTCDPEIMRVPLWCAPLLRRSGVVLARTSEGVWLGSLYDDWVEVAHPDGTYTAYVPEGYRYPRRQAELLVIAWALASLGFLGAIAVLFARAADAAGRAGIPAGPPDLGLAIGAAVAVLLSYALVVGRAEFEYGRGFSLECWIDIEPFLSFHAADEAMLFCACWSVPAVALFTAIRGRSWPAIAITTTLAAALFAPFFESKMMGALELKAW
jgi:hypothetical protein